MEILALVAAAGLVAWILRIALILRPVPGAKLPHPSKISGMPMASSASTGTAHTALNRNGRARRPQFRT